MTAGNPTALASLAALISAVAQTLETAYAKHGLVFPSLDEPFYPGPLDDDLALTNAARLIVAAAHQIIATVRAPMDTIQDYAPAMYMTSALAFANETNIADVLKNVPQGLHVQDISKEVGVDSVKIARILRYLATRHVFREISPNVFANNRISSFLAKSRPLKALKSDAVNRYKDAPAAAFVGHVTDEAFSSAVCLSTHVREDAKDYESPFNLAFRTKKTMWEWYEEPGNEWRGRRFAEAMKGSGDRFPASIFTGGFDWRSLKDDSVVVDVGGSLGTVTLKIAKAFPHLKYVVEDLEPVVTGPAQKFWEAQAPELLASSRVTLQVQNFFEPQAIKQAAVYFMRFVLHDWPDSANETILRNLRNAAAPYTKLVIFESIMPYASPDPNGPPRPPFPLLANLGLPVGGFLTMLDLQMMNILNGQERTFEQFVELGARTGWRFEGVKPGVLAALVFSVA
ncbi:S-adenosyl-L-methionine-dependent methyltransferase [Auriscalpium vulgare]|uniref:S-adenosyl-L-methionine-dependent methyltransferase n=1 Tax=Auriscalpium vulgare TaxID=40419 RepID=A0ACB8R9L4_9AGAM|nr:S-adenosyl-L-methionine-dependent methyltransferase [Auriscalpium vulgare]